MSKWIFIPSENNEIVLNSEVIYCNIVKDNVELEQ